MRARNKGKAGGAKRDLFADVRVTLIVSFVSAALLWVVVAGFIQPGGDKIIKDIAIDYTSRAYQYEDRGLQMTGTLTDVYADVRLLGNGSVTGPLDHTSVSVYADFAQVSGPGAHKVPIRAVPVAPGNYDIDAISVKSGGYSLERNPYSMVTVVFEEVSSKEITVQVRADGITAAEGFVRDAPVSRTERVFVSGARSQVDRVAGIAAVVPGEEELSERRRYAGIPLTLLDANGQAIDRGDIDVELTAEAVDVDIDIFEIRVFNIAVEFINKPGNLNSEWFHNRLTYSSNTLRVVGQSGALSSIGNPLVIETFDASLLHFGWEASVEVSLPEELRNYDSLRRIAVSLNTTGMAERIVEVPPANIRVLNGPQNADVVPINEPVNVRLLGDEAQIEAILADNITIQVDAAGITAGRGGQQNIPARVLVPGFDKVIPIESYSVICAVTVD